MFDKLKNVFELQKQAKEVRKQLGGITIENTKLNGQIKVKINGEFEIIDLQIESALLKEGNQNTLAANLKACINEAQTKAKAEIARKMRASMMGGSNVPGF